MIECGNENNSGIIFHTLAETILIRGAQHMFLLKKISTKSHLILSSNTSRHFATVLYSENCDLRSFANIKAAAKYFRFTMTS